MATVLLHPDVDSWLQNQQPDVEAQIRKRLELAAEDPRHYLEPLTGRDDYKLVAGGYRCTIEWDKSDDTLYVMKAGKRDKYYD